MENNLLVGDIVECQITGIASYGIFVKVNQNICGLIHISEICSRYINDLSSKYHINQYVKARVIEVDYDKSQAKLSLNKVRTRKNALVEKGHGFEPLKENLDFWISERIMEIKKNKKHHKNFI